MNNYLMVPVKGVKEDLITETKQLIYVPVATENTFGSVKLGHDFKLVNGKLTQKRASGSKTYVGYSDNNEDIGLELLEDDVVVLEYDLYINVISGDLFQYYQVDDRYEWVKVGNVKGPAGTFKISKTYTSIQGMNDSYSSDGLPEGALVLINSLDVEDPDNAKLFVKGPSMYQYLTDMSGARGVQGPQGDVGPVGPRGPQGEVGPQGLQGEPAITDGELSSTSENAVQNKVVTLELQDIKNTLGDVGSVLDEINGEVI